jgi:acyl-CoA thioesterase-1
MMKIIFFVDSLTAGYGLRNPDSEAVPALIAQKLLAKGMDFEVVNAGMSGDTSRSALSRLDEVLQGEVAGFVLELGANDFLRGFPPQEVYSNLRSIIERVKLRYPDAWILLLGIELPTWAMGAYAVGYADIFSSLAKEMDIDLLPSFLKGVAGKAHLNMPDGVHPLAKGYAMAAENLWPIMFKILHNCVR